MNRRSLLIGTGAAITTAAFTAACGQAQPGLRPLSPAKPGSPPIVEALRYGITAPSAHNTQPWRIELVSQTEARLFFDPARLLPVTDPPGRQVHISHGTLVEMTSIAATHFGYRADVQVLPEGEMPLREFGTKPTAVVQLQRDPTILADPLFTQVLHRRSSRLAHDGPLVSEQELRTMVEHTRASKVKLGLVPQTRLREALDIVKRAMEVEVNDFDLYEETRRWFRFDDEQIERHGDGLNFRTSGVSPARLRLARTFLTDDNWHAKRNLRVYLANFAKAVDTTRGLLTITTASNTMHDWIATGRAYVRAQLAAGELGLRFHPVSQSLQEYPQMAQLRPEIDAVVGVEAPSKLQMLIRVGRTQPPGLSPRRGVDAVVSSAPPPTR